MTTVCTTRRHAGNQRMLLLLLPLFFDCGIVIIVIRTRYQIPCYAGLQVCCNVYNTREPPRTYRTTQLGHRGQVKSLIPPKRAPAWVPAHRCMFRLCLLLLLRCRGGCDKFITTALPLECFIQFEWSTRIWGRLLCCSTTSFLPVGSFFFMFDSISSIFICTFFSITCCLSCN